MHPRDSDLHRLHSEDPGGTISGQEGREQIWEDLGGSGRIVVPRESDGSGRVIHPVDIGDDGFLGFPNEGHGEGYWWESQGDH